MGKLQSQRKNWNIKLSNPCFSYWVDKCSWGWKSTDICLGEKQTSLIAGLAGGKVPINRPVVCGISLATYVLNRSQ